MITAEGGRGLTHNSEEDVHEKVFADAEAHQDSERGHEPSDDLGETRLVDRRGGAYLGSRDAHHDRCLGAQPSIQPQETQRSRTEGTDDAPTYHP
jgi:hypothetical protein